MKPEQQCVSLNIAKQLPPIFGEVLPKLGFGLKFIAYHSEVYGTYSSGEGSDYAEHALTADTMVDAMGKMVIWLSEQGLFAEAHKGDEK